MAAKGHNNIASVFNPGQTQAKRAVKAGKAGGKACPGALAAPSASIAPVVIASVAPAPDPAPCAAA